jgi:transitional endoplasmic reticulum ATPase
MNTNTGTLPKGFVIDQKYKVLLSIKRGRNAETYRVKGSDGKLYFLKLFDFLKLERSAFDDENRLLEAHLLSQVRHENIVTYKESGEIINEGRRLGYLALSFIAGETLAERMIREPFTNMYDIRIIVRDVLEALEYLHSLPSPIIHNEITPDNVMIDLSVNVPKAILIDFGSARNFSQSKNSFNKKINLLYTASECFNDLFSPSSDIFSAGAVMYQMMLGSAPWIRDISKHHEDPKRIEELVIKERKKTLLFPVDSSPVIDIDNRSVLILKKALHSDPETRFNTAAEFSHALQGDDEIGDVDKLKKVPFNEKVDSKPVKIAKGKGSGFEAIAGMSQLKEQMRIDVINALREPEEYARYGVTIPNGMLLYGPPGCGKTFFAKHFAEEVGFNFLLATPSMLKSRYVNATQENIAKMFEEAERNAPTIIFIDEINELLPSRDSDAHEMSKSAVNEMLAQMDRTGEKGIFIIGATNYPDKIDPAMLRAGRLDKKFYLPPPDSEARKALFEMYLKNRPVDFGIDYHQLAEKTENYVSSDIAFLVNESARKALQQKGRITMQILEETIKATRPSVPLEEIQKYEKIRARMNGEKIDPDERPRIGFKR